MKVFILSLFVTLLCGSAKAELRQWEDQAGHQYEAEFVRELFDVITLRETDGTEHRVAVEDLSEHDQKYIRVMVPPVMEINFFRDFRAKPKPVELSDDDNDITTILGGRVQIRKVSRRPFTSGLRAEIYLIAEEEDGDNYILVDRTESGFLFTQNDTHEFKIKESEIIIYREYNHQRRGEVYLGYVVAVSDARGNIVQVETDIDWLADKVEQLRELYIRGAASKYSRHFDKETVQKAEVPRPLYYPGRMR